MAAHSACTKKWAKKGHKYYTGEDHTTTLLWKSFLSQMVNDMGKSDNKAVLETITALGNGLLGLMGESIAASERMHTASLTASKDMLEAALKGAENCSPEQFECLVGALERVTVAGVEAEKSVHLARMENGRAFIKSATEVAASAVSVVADVGSVLAGAKAKETKAELITAKARWVEAKAKETNSGSERIKAKAHSERVRNGVMN